MTQQIQLGSIDVAVSFKDIKNVHLSVHPPDGRVTVSAPLHMDVDTIRVYAATKLAWIKKERSKILEQERQGEKVYITRESHFLFGKRYLLKHTPSAQPRIIVHHSKIEMKAPAHYDATQKEALLYRFYRRELRTKLDTLVTVYATKMGLPIPSFGIRRMKTKWGSCASERRHLWFNIELAKKPLDCIEYIVVHEMAHLLERRHNQHFTEIVARYFPGWEVQRKLLNELPL